MCGIVGIVGRQEPAWLARMNVVQHHRGPDDTGEYRDEAAGVALAMSRLSILDLAHGHQPMTSASGRSVIVFNGEIFNSPELRARLERDGEVFRTANSDTEVLLALWERKAERMLDDLNGMFAFAIHDRESGVVFGARDPIGIKPLYYAELPGAAAFASELKALLTLPGVSREIDQESLFHYASLRFVPGASSIFAGIKRVPPGHFFRLEAGSSTICVERYWSLTFQPDTATPAEEWPARVREGLSRAVRRWALSDVPIACSLSGGLDSSAIVGLLSEDGGATPRTYSLGFAEEAASDLNELPLARQVAARFGAEHHEIILGADDVLRDLLKMVWSLDEPYGGGLPSWYVFEFMSKDVKVGLTGSGGDELFGDYGRYREYERNGKPSAVEHLAARLALPAPAAANAVAHVRERLSRSTAAAGPLSLPRFRREYVERYYYFSQEAQRALFRAPASADTTAMLAAHSRDGHPRDAIAAVSFGTQLPDEFLAMTDRFSMAHSLEARVPFLDREFVTLTASVPASIRTRPHDPKYLLKRAVSDLLPQEVLRGRKRGFVIPTAHWLRGTLRPLVERLLGREHLEAQGIFQPAVYDRLVVPHITGRADHQAQIWTLLMFQLWHAVFIEQAAADVPAAVWSDLC